MSSAAIAAPTSARVALCALDEFSAAALRDSFRQFNIESVVLAGDFDNHFRKSKFEACVVPLGSPEAFAILYAARNSDRNRPIIVYGLCSSAQQSLRLSRFGLNALIDFPVERTKATKIIRSTHLLVVNEFRRYARIPVVADVLVKHGAATTRAHSLEVSAGGISVESALHLQLNALVILSFTLPNASTVAIGARVCWHHGKETGFRFEPGDVERNHVKEWIENYLGL